MLSLGWREGGRKKISVELGGQDEAWSGLKLMGYGKAVVEAGNMIHDLFPCVVNALAKYGEVARGTEE